MPTMKLSPSAEAECGRKLFRSRYLQNHIVKNAVSTPQFLEADALVVPMFGAAFFRRGAIGTEAVADDVQQAVALVLRITVMQAWHHRGAGEIMLGNLADGPEQ